MLKPSLVYTVGPSLGRKRANKNYSVSAGIAVCATMSAVKCFLINEDGDRGGKCRGHGQSGR